MAIVNCQSYLIKVFCSLLSTGEGVCAYRVLSYVTFLNELVRTSPLSPHFSKEHKGKLTRKYAKIVKPPYKPFTKVKRYAVMMEENAHFNIDKFVAVLFLVEHVHA